MRRVLVSLVLLAATTTLVNADPHNLSGGALITHYNPHYYSRYLECWVFYDHPITDCGDQDTSIPYSDYDAWWYVIAAFEEDKEWCEVQFGFSDFEPYLFMFRSWEPCYPGCPPWGGGIEIASPGWPGPGEGTTIIATEGPWEGNWVPVYAFRGYPLLYYGPGVMQLVPDPTAEIPFGGFRNCATPPGEWDAALGGMGVDHPGTWVCWQPGDKVCCIGADCVIVHGEDECVGLGGEYYPEWDDCGPPNPCVVTPATTTKWGTIKALYR